MNWDPFVHEEVQDCQLQILFILAVFVLLENHASHFEILPSRQAYLL